MPLDPKHPLPDLKVYPTSGLSFPWAEHHPGGHSGFEASFGPEGVTLMMQMFVYWQDLTQALKELLGYSVRDTTTSPPTLRRHLPWQHPFSSHIWVKNVSAVKGLRMEQLAFNTNDTDPGAGPGYQPNTGPWSNFYLALLTIHFWRPPYAIRSDGDILDSNLRPQEWLRYVDKFWTIDTQMLSREGQQMKWVQNQGNPTVQFQGSVGQKFTKLKVRRRWYQIPERALFLPAQDLSPNGLPLNLLYTQTPTTNPITGYVYPARMPIGGCVNAPIGGGTPQATPPYILDNDPTKQFFGCPTGTLLLEGIEFIPQALQLPAGVMEIPSFSTGEPLSQVQYDVVFHFEFFDPPAFRKPTGYPGSVPDPWGGYNLAPFSGNGLWYAVQTARGQDGVNAPSYPTNPALTPFHYADFSDLFTIL